MQNLPTIDKSWANHIELPPPGNMMERHERAEDVFVRQGTRMANAIVAAMAKHSTKPLSECMILDFGCGCGRVALPMFHFMRKPNYCVDVDASVIAYLNEQIPAAHPTVTQFDPPLPFEDDFFDIVFSVSIWTHLDLQYADRWLVEIRRILRPGGLALVTTSNYAALAHRQSHPILGPMGWSSITDEQLKKDGFIFIKTPSAPGTGLYGMASHDPDYVRKAWSAYMPVVDIIPGAIEGLQDINVMRKDLP